MVATIEPAKKMTGREPELVARKWRAQRLPGILRFKQTVVESTSIALGDLTVDMEAAETDVVHVGRKVPMEHIDDPWTIALIIVLLLMFALSGYAITMEFFKWLRE